MSYMLRSYDQSPPGNYYYEQPPPNYRRFGPNPMIDGGQGLARQVLAFRSGNGIARASYPECLEDIGSYTCNRLKGNSSFCVELPSGGEGIPLAANAPGLQLCRGCGNKVD